MRRILVVLISCAVAAGCGGGAQNPTSPTVATPAPPPATTPVTAGAWQGTVVAIRRTLAAPLDTTQTFEGTVTFERGDANGFVSPEGLAPLIPPGAATYVLRPGLLQLTHTGAVGPCSYGRSTWDVLMKRSDGYLFVRSDGNVGGRLTLPETVFPVTVTCPNGATRGDTSVQMDLLISGAVAFSRIAGTMTPSTVAGTTFSGSGTLEAR